MKYPWLQNVVIVALIFSTVLLSCASRKNRRASKELKSPAVEIVKAESEEAEAVKKEAAAVAPAAEKPMPAEKPVVEKKKPVVEVPLRVELPDVNREFRGAWVATVANINWPTKGNYSTEAQKREAIQL